MFDALKKLLKMSQPVIVTVETERFKYSESRQPLITWLEFMNFLTVAVLSLLFLKIYNGMLLLYEWFFPSRHKKLLNPVILVLGSKTELNQEIVRQLSEMFDSQIIQLSDVNDNFQLCPKPEPKRSLIIFTQMTMNRQVKAAKLSDFIRSSFGEVDLLMVSQKEELPINGQSTDAFLTHLNTQLLSQFMTVMTFLPRMLQRDSGRIVSIALSRTSTLANTGIMRSVHEELMQSETKVKLTLVERNQMLDDYLPRLPPDLLARLIIKSVWSSNTVVVVPSMLYYALISPLLITRILIRSIGKILSITTSRHHQSEVFR